MYVLQIAKSISKSVKEKYVMDSIIKLTSLKVHYGWSCYMIYSTWYVDGGTFVEVLWEELGVQCCTHHNYFQIHPFYNQILQNQQQEVTERQKSCVCQTHVCDRDVMCTCAFHKPLFCPFMDLIHDHMSDATELRVTL